jgi:predicted alpha/beta hydrolase
MDTVKIESDKPTPMTTFQIKTSDQVKIVVNHFVPASSNGRVVLINPATGIKQTFYFNYAEYLSELGYDVITYDFRGIGKSKTGSLRGFKASMVDWVAKDFSAVTQYILNHFSDDKMSPGKAVDVMANRVYKNALVERLHIEVNESAPVGHLRFFKERFKGDLWPIPFHWIDKVI